MSDPILFFEGKLRPLKLETCNIQMCKKKIQWGTVVEPDVWRSLAGAEGHITSYFTENQLWGYLSANPEVYNALLVVEFLNNSMIHDGVITSTVGKVRIRVTEESFAETFGLEYNNGAGVNKKVAEPLLQEMLKEKKAPAIDLEEWGKSLWARPRTHFNCGYSSLAFILVRDIEGRVGDMSGLTHERLSLMYHVHKNLEVDWCKYIFSRWLDVISKFKMVMWSRGVCPQTSTGFGLRIMYLLKEHGVAMIGKKLDKGKFFGKTDNLGPKEGRKRKATPKKPVKAQKKKKTTAVPELIIPDPSSSATESEEEPAEDPKFIEEPKIVEVDSSATESDNPEVQLISSRSRRRERREFSRALESRRPSPDSKQLSPEPIPSPLPANSDGGAPNSDGGAPLPEQPDQAGPSSMHVSSPEIELDDAAINALQASRKKFRLWQKLRTAPMPLLINLIKEDEVRALELEEWALEFAGPDLSLDILVMQTLEFLNQLMEFKYEDYKQQLKASRDAFPEAPHHSSSRDNDDEGGVGGIGGETAVDPSDPKGKRKVGEPFEPKDSEKGNKSGDVAAEPELEQGAEKMGEQIDEDADDSFADLATTEELSVHDQLPQLRNESIASQTTVRVEDLEPEVQSKSKSPGEVEESIIAAEVLVNFQDNIQVPVLTISSSPEPEQPSTAMVLAPETILIQPTGQSSIMKRRKLSKAKAIAKRFRLIKTSKAQHRNVDTQLAVLTDEIQQLRSRVKSLENQGTSDSQTLPNPALHEITNLRMGLEKQAEISENLKKLVEEMFQTRDTSTEIQNLHTARLGDLEKAIDKHYEAISNQILTTNNLIESYDGLKARMDKNKEGEGKSRRQFANLLAARNAQRSTPPPSKPESLWSNKINDGNVAEMYKQRRLKGLYSNLPFEAGLNKFTSDVFKAKDKYEKGLALNAYGIEVVKRAVIRALAKEEMLTIYPDELWREFRITERQYNDTTRKVEDTLKLRLLAGRRTWFFAMNEWFKKIYSDDNARNAETCGNLAHQQLNEWLDNFDMYENVPAMFREQVV